MSSSGVSFAEPRNFKINLTQAVNIVYTMERDDQIRPLTSKTIHYLRLLHLRQ